MTFSSFGCCFFHRSHGGFGVVECKYRCSVELVGTFRCVRCVTSFYLGDRREAHQKGTKKQTGGFGYLKKSNVYRYY